MVALGRVVVDHVDHDLDAGLVQAADHGLPLGEVAGREVARLRREEADRVVAPIVGELALDQVPVLDEGVNRQELDRRDAQRPQVVDHLRDREAGGRAPVALRHIRVPHREAAQMGLVEDALVPGHVRSLVVAPGEGGVDHPAFQHAAGIVPCVGAREVVARAADAVAEMRVRPAQLAPELLCVRVEEELRWIEAVARRPDPRAHGRGSRRAGPGGCPADSRARPGPYTRAERSARSHARRADRTGTARPSRHWR